MSQISPPLRILLVGSVLFLAAYMVFLRPGGGTDTAATAPATTPAAASTPASAPGQVVQNAEDAAAAAGSAAAASAGEAPATDTAPDTSAAAGTAPAPSAAPSDENVDTKGLPADVARAVKAEKVLVLLFWNPKAADDRAVRAELRQVDRHGGRVAVHVADVRRIARYAPIARGVEVEQSPSVVVVDGDRKASLLTGYTDSGSMDQAVADALGIDALIAEKPVNAYYRSVNKLCSQAEAELKLDDLSKTPAGFASAMAQAAAVSSVYDKKFRALDTPKRHRAFAKRFAAYNAQGTAFLTRVAVQARGARTPAEIQPIVTQVVQRAQVMETRGAEQFGQYGIANCI